MEGNSDGDIMLPDIVGCLIKHALRRQVLDVLAQASWHSRHGGALFRP
jgi:hypothetical protein